MIDVTRLTKRFGRTVAVEDLSFTVRPGTVTGFLGPNGAGKSTTIRSILGLVRPDSGTALVSGRPYGDLERPLLTVGALLDTDGAHPGRSGFHHLLWLAQSNGLGRRRVEAVLARVGLSDVARRRVAGFSLGMRRRLGLAAALLGDPPVLVLDEPVNGLDPDGVRWTRELLRSLAAEGRTILVSSHLMGETAATAGHVVVVGRGRLLADMPTREFVERHAVPVVRVTTPAPANLHRALGEAGHAVSVGPDGRLEVAGTTPDAVRACAARQGLPIVEAIAATASLEEAFLTLTRDHAGHAALRPEGR